MEPDSELNLINDTKETMLLGENQKEKKPSLCLVFVGFKIIFSSFLKN